MPNEYDFFFDGGEGSGDAGSFFFGPPKKSAKKPAKKPSAYASLQQTFGEEGKGGGSLLSRALDALQRASYAQGAAVDVLVEDLTDQKKDSWADLGQTLKEALRAAGRGLTGKDKEGWQRAAHRLPESLDVKIPEAVPLVGGKQVPVRSAAGFAADILADPMNKVGIGAKVINPETGKATRQVLSYAGKGWEDLPGVAGKVAKAVDETVGSALDDLAENIRQTPLGQWFAKKLSTRGTVADKEFADLTKKARQNAEYLVEQEVKKGVTREKALREVVKKTGIPQGDLLDLIEKPAIKETKEAASTFAAHTVKKGDTWEKIAKQYGTTPERLKELNKAERFIDLPMGKQLKVPVMREVEVSRLADKPASVAEMVKQYGQENAERLNIERAKGIDTPALDSDVLEYMHRHRTPEARKAAKKAGVGWKPMLDTTVQHGATKERTLLKDLSIKQINELSQAGELDKVIPGFRGKLYEDNPALVQTLRDIISAKAIAAAEFVDEVMANPQWATKGEAPSTWVELSEKAVKDRFGSKVKGVKFRPDIAEALQKHVRDEFDPKQVDGFWRGYDKALGAWKEITLGLSPSWIKNNVIGNVFNNYLADVNPAEYGTAALVQKGKPLVIASKSGKRYTSQVINELAGRLGVTDSGLYGADVAKTIEQQISGKGQNLLRRTTFRANRAIENNARLANFIDGLKKGLSPEEAAKRVNEHLFDYGDLTDWEKDVAKRIAPFYTWYRKNTQLQLEMMLTKPGKYTVIPKAANAIEANQKERGELADKRYLPEWLKKDGAVQVSTSERGNPEYMSMRAIPAFDVRKTPNELASSNPLATAISLAAMGFDPYTGKLIPKEAQGTLLGMPMSERSSRALQALVPPLRNLDTLVDPRDAPPWSSIPTPDLAERLKGLFFGKTYERDPMADYDYAMRDWERRMDDAQRALSDAEASGNNLLAARYRAVIEKLWQEQPQ